MLEDQTQAANGRRAITGHARHCRSRAASILARLVGLGVWGCAAVAVAQQTPPRPAAAPPRDPARLAASLEHGVGFLLADQNADGSWGTPERTKGLNIYAPAPGAHQAFRAAVTALCVTALIEHGGSSSAEALALSRGEEWLLAHLAAVRRATPDAIYNVWAHGYGVQALVRMHGRTSDRARRERIESLLRGQFERLVKYESIDGGWGYYDFRAGTLRPAADSTSFVNAAVLIALHEAQEIGVEPPVELVRRAVESTRRQRKPDFSYLYGEYLWHKPMLGINRPGGSLGRSQACNAALRVWGDDRVTDEVLEVWLDRLFARNLWLDLGRKRPIPHESHFQVAGYFFYFGHYYAARCLELLPSEHRARHQDQLAQRLLALQEEDGSWWDYPFYNYHQQYGTAFAVMSLLRCR